MLKVTSKNQQKIQPIKASVLIQSNVDLQIMLWNKKCTLIVTFYLKKGAVIPYQADARFDRFII